MSSAVMALPSVALGSGQFGVLYTSTLLPWIAGKSLPSLPACVRTPCTAVGAFDGAGAVEDGRFAGVLVRSGLISMAFDGPGLVGRLSLC